MANKNSIPAKPLTEGKEKSQTKKFKNTQPPSPPPSPTPQKTKKTDIDDVTQSVKFFKQEQIDVFVSKNPKSSFDEKGIMHGERRKLIILHQNGNDKQETISQLKLIIIGIEDDFASFSC